MAKEPEEKPRFHRGQVVMISRDNERGEVVNDLARKAVSYFAKPGVLVTCKRYSTRPLLVYGVKMDDGTILQLTEDCLVPVRDFS